jgi:predicted XRE-type DNA-binding protein
MNGYREIGQQLADQLAEALRRSGLTQRELAARLGMTQSSVSQTLRGRYPDWRISTMVRMASGLGYRIRISLEKVDS